MFSAGGRIYRLLNRFFSLFFLDYFVKQILDELLILRTRLYSRRTRKAYKGKTDLMVNIGSGECGKAGWVNVDSRNRAGVNCLWDCRRNLPFDDNSVKFIFTEHFIEHIDYYKDMPLLLKDIMRVLQPGGMVRIIVPDIEIYLNGYVENGWGILSKARPLLENNVDYWTKNVMHTKMELINIIFRQNYEHKYSYDFETMKHCLAKAGFKNIIKQEYNKSSARELLIDMPIRATESLYVEATK